jgi:hypothetical protein
MSIKVAMRALSEAPRFSKNSTLQCTFYENCMQDHMIKTLGRIVQLYEDICALKCGCTSKIARVAVKGAEMAVIFGWSGSEGLVGLGNTGLNP